MPVNDSRAGRSLIVAQVSGVVAGLVFLLSAAASTEKTNFDDAALDQHTTSIFPQVDGYPIHVGQVDEIQPMLDGWRARGSMPIVLWLGNSQLHAVNQARQEAVPASAKLFPQLAAEDLDLLTISVPNANLQEHYLTFEAIVTQVDVACLVLPVVFDDFRESGVRTNLIPLVSRCEESLHDTEVGRIIVANSAEVANPDSTQTATTLQDASERRLNDWLGDNLKIWEVRSELRGKCFLSLYKYRNRIFGISAQSKRRQIPGRFKLNWAALEALLDSAARRKVPVLMYIVPLRSDVETPYDAREYEQFKKALRDLATEKSVAFRNPRRPCSGCYVGTDGKHCWRWCWFGLYALPRSWASAVIRRVVSRDR